MATSLIAASVLGFLTGLGVGGGSLLILWLTLAAGVSADDARGINLLFFLPAAFISCLFRLRQGHLHLGTNLPAIIAGCMAAAVFSFIGTRIHTQLLKKLFALLLLATGLRELFYHPKNSAPQNN